MRQARTVPTRLHNKRPIHALSYDRQRKASRAYKCGERLTRGKRGEHLLPLLHRSSRPSCTYPRLSSRSRSSSTTARRLQTVEKKSHLRRSATFAKSERSFAERRRLGSNAAVSSGDFHRVYTRANANSWRAYIFEIQNRERRRKNRIIARARGRGIETTESASRRMRFVLAHFVAALLRRAPSY